MSENVLVDSTIWSLALRRHRPDEHLAITDELTWLVTEHRALLIGPIRQEVLSGIREKSQFERLDQLLLPFANEPIIEDDYRDAARYYNECRARGIQGSHVDLLLCAVSLRLDANIFTTDQDFTHYRTVLGIRLHETTR